MPSEMSTVAFPPELFAAAARQANRLAADYPRTRLSAAAIVRAITAAALGEHDGLSLLDRTLAERIADGGLDLDDRDDEPAPEVH